jgi:hypothetical protein
VRHPERGQGHDPSAGSVGVRGSIPLISIVGSRACGRPQALFSLWQSVGIRPNEAAVEAGARQALQPSLPAAGAQPPLRLAAGAGFRPAQSGALGRGFIASCAPARCADPAKTAGWRKGERSFRAELDPRIPPGRGPAEPKPFTQRSPRRLACSALSLDLPLNWH